MVADDLLKHTLIKEHLKWPTTVYQSTRFQHSGGSKSERERMTEKKIYKLTHSLVLTMMKEHPNRRHGNHLFLWARLIQAPWHFVRMCSLILITYKSSVSKVISIWIWWWLARPIKSLTSSMAIKFKIFLSTMKQREDRKWGSSSSNNECIIWCAADNDQKQSNEWIREKKSRRNKPNHVSFPCGRQRIPIYQTEKLNLTPVTCICIDFMQKHSTHSECKQWHLF